MQSRLDAIQKLKHPMTVKGCRSFTGMVNFLNILCPELQKLLKPIYDLTIKSRQFILAEEHIAVSFWRGKAWISKAASVTFTR